GVAPALRSATTGFFFSSRRRHTRFSRDWSSDVCSSDLYVARAIECMARVAPVSYRRIFHGVGVYHRSVLFALIVNDRLYFRVDEHSRALYEQQGLRPFQPAAAERAESAFYEVPESILERPSELLQWIDRKSVV